MNLSGLNKLLKAGEWNDVEFKEARTDVPKSAFETVSAFANTHGGRLVFGVRLCDARRQVGQRGDVYEVTGVEKPDKVQNDFLSVLHADAKINHGVAVTEQRLHIGGKTVLVFQAAENQRTRKPVYLDGGHPSPTYKNDRAGKAFELFIPELDKEVDMASDLVKAMFGAKTPTQSGDPVKAHDEAHDEAHDRISDIERKILSACADRPQSTPDLLSVLGYGNRTGNLKKALVRMRTLELLELTIPGKPRSKNQRYRITNKGRKRIVDF